MTSYSNYYVIEILKYRYIQLNFIDFFFLFYSIPIFEYTTLYLSTLLLMDSLFPVFAIMSNAAFTIIVHVKYYTHIRDFLGYILRSEIAGL